MIPEGYEQYLEDGERTREIQIDHWNETLQIVMMTKKYRSKQLADRLGCSSSTTFDYLNKTACPRPFVKKRLMGKLIELIREKNQLNIFNHGRINV